jgi:tRNA (cytosine49-C5)-methyltransferase
MHAFERYRGIIPDYEGFLEASRQPLPAHIRINTLKIGVEQAREFMVERGYELEPVKGVEEAFRLRQPETPGSTLEFFLGYYHIQGLTSMFPAKILDPQAGEVILDLCAAPGGKATYLAQLMKNRGLVVANDTKIDRIRILRSHIDRLGTTSLIVSRYDGQIFPTHILFDRILIDPPCSGEGTYRFGRYAPLSADPDVIRRLGGLQQKLLRRGLDVLRPGGTLVYSTCTYAPEENEEVIDPIVMNGEAELLPILIPFPHSSGLTSWGKKTFHADLTKTVRIYPNQVDSWGFFIAKLRKLE